MTRKIIIPLILLTLLIIGCTPEESADLPTAESTSESAVNPIEEPVESATPEASNNAGNTDIITVDPAGSVDLGQITPDADSSGDLVVQPAPGAPGLEAEAVIQLSIQALAGRLGIDAGEITLLEVAPQDWPDSSLGCPSPDQLYAAVITPGYEITLEAQGQSYSYHTDKTENVILCIDGRPAE
ncbi:MAG: hypothetical protein WAM60_00145 [Candidatus Promineifilaceae bacterium]